jgi:hypothetical protein
MSTRKRKPVLVGEPGTTPVMEGRMGNAGIARDLRNGPALERWGCEIVKDVVNFGVGVDMVLSFHNALEGWDH